MLTPGGSGVTVVIATLGGGLLEQTIRTLNEGIVAPDEILICIPTEFANRVRDLPGRNVRVLETSVKGQVAQRAEGFKAAGTPFVLQLDDDILLDTGCVAQLRSSLLLLKGKVAIAPSLVDLESGLSVYHRPEKLRVVRSLIDLLLDGRNPQRGGYIGRSGRAIGLDPASCTGQGLVEVDWLPGGCVLHRRENLICYNFFPNPGKAYCEDLFHSHYLRASGVGLYVDLLATCRLENPTVLDYGFRQFFTDMRGDYGARRKLLILKRIGLPRMHLYYAFMIGRYFIRSFARFVRRNRPVAGGISQP